MIALDAYEIGYKAVVRGLQAELNTFPAARAAKAASCDYFAVSSDGN